MLENVTCAYNVSGEESYSACDQPATNTLNFFPVCEEHLVCVRKMNQAHRRSVALQSSKFHDLSDFPGHCYIVLCPDATVKIGYSNTDETLAKRLTNLNRDIGPIVKLAVIPAGFVAEAVLHDRFDKWRIPDKQERFEYSPEMAEYIASLS